jgi:VanZ family protein
MTIHRSIFLVLAIYWGVLFVGTHIPAPIHQGVQLGDKMLHFLAFAGLGFLLAWAAMGRRATLAGAMAVWLVVMTYGMLDELTQTLVPSRTMEVNDWLADAAGGLAGLISYFVTQWLYLYLFVAIRPAADPQ